jgi:hypothetical protein
MVAAAKAVIPGKSGLKKINALRPDNQVILERQSFVAVWAPPQPQVVAASPSILGIGAEQLANINNA